MLISLSSGRTIEMSIDQYLDMSDEEFNYLNVHHGIGDSVEDPWYGSALSKGLSIEDLDDLQDMVDIPIQEKIIDLDVDPELE